MLREVSTLKGLTVSATDGEIGSVYDVYFDTKHWTVRYGQLAGGAPRPRLAHVAPRRGRDRGPAEREAQQDAGGASAQLGH
jgi:hypothetical protein